MKLRYLISFRNVTFQTNVDIWNIQENSWCSNAKQWYV